MKFCYNCGTALSGTEKFCGQCGARIEHKPAPPVHGVSPVPSSETSAHVMREQDQEVKARNCSRRGVIFTNISALSRKLGTDRKVLERLFEQYADGMASADIDLLPVSEFSGDSPRAFFHTQLRASAPLR